MSSFALIQFGACLLAAFFGAAIGWWLRGGQRTPKVKKREVPQKRVAAQVLQSLQAAADTVRACVEQHTDCIRTIQSELNDATATEPAIITKLAESIVASSGLVQHQCNDIRSTIDSKRKEIRDCLASSDGLLFTFAALDRQQQMYRQVLTSLEVLATELATEVKGHGQRLQKISGTLEGESASADGLTSAVTQILDATESVQKRISATEDRIAAQAEAVEMQAILTHADLLTSLPNRRALETEVQRAAVHSGRTPLATLVFVDLDGFSIVNSEYGHQGGDLILRQAAGMIKKQARGREMVARFCGDTFAVLLNQTTLHDALPLAERLRKVFQDSQFSHGANPLCLTASIGIAQLRPDEMRDAVTERASQALSAAKQAGGNVCFRHDGEGCHPVSSAFGAKREEDSEDSLTLAALWRDSSTPVNADGTTTEAQNATAVAKEDVVLSGRSLFAANLTRRIAEWKRGGASVSVAVLRIDQLNDLVNRFGEQGQAFLRQVMGRLLEAATRDMDERCEFEDGLFALILPGTDEANALAVADRLCSQVRQCKVRMGIDLWDLTASIGVANCSVSSRVMDIVLSAEAAMRAAAEQGGGAVCIGQPVKEPLLAAKI